MKKYKATGCARFFVVMLVLAPLAYVGASYYNGQDPIENVKALINGDERPTNNERTNEDTEESAPAESAIEDAQENLEDLEKEIENIKIANENLIEENDGLKERIKTLEAELEQLKAPEDGNE